MTGSYESLPPKRKLQNICGLCFIILFTVQFICQTLLITGVIPQQANWYAYVVGACSVVGFTLLVVLASNYSCRTFALCLLGFELFFTFGRPFMLSLSQSDKPSFPLIFWAALLFNVVALYLWGVLFQNCHFKRRDLYWLLLLPIPFIVNIMGYGGYLSLFSDLNSIASLAVSNPPTLSICRVILAVFLPVGYWKLSHNENFSGHNTDRAFAPNFSPFNRYFFGYLLVALLLFIPF